MKRADGRGPSDLRPVKLSRAFQPNPEGSCLIDVGQTRVVCAATVEPGVPQFLRGSGRGWVTAEYSMLPRATVERTPREVKSGRPSGRTQRLIGRSLRAVTDLTLLGERSITIDCDVLVADGGTRTASITGAYVALADAIASLMSLGELPVSPLISEVAAISVGVLEDTPVLDLDYTEDVAVEVDMNVVMTGKGGLVEVQGTAEGEPFDRALLDGMLDLAASGIEQLVAMQRAVLTE